MLSGFVVLLLCIGLMVLWSMILPLKREARRLEFDLGVLSFKECFYRKYRAYLGNGKADTMNFDEFLIHYRILITLPFYEVNTVIHKDEKSIDVRISKAGITATLTLPFFGFKKV